MHLMFKLKALTSNEISIANPTRTGTRRIVLTSIVSFNREMNKPYQLKMHNHKLIDSKLMYGRLFTEEQFIEIIVRGTIKAHAIIMRKAILTSSMRVGVRRGNVLHHTITRAFPPTDDLEVLKAMARSLALEIAPYRQQKGIDKSNDMNWLQVVLGSLSIKQMIPNRLAVKLKEAEDEFFICINMLRKFGFWRLRDNNLSRSRANSAQIISQYGLLTKEVMEGTIMAPDKVSKGEKIIEI
ncbi:unnamed protein product [Phytomonas sp. Hart1]|nr:unnamed protein product [Phytomonas sp. Hart1]|eukprot:CCW68675.1 unnamed protein product [Phytomonas sp. isolate Hart1]